MKVYLDNNFFSVRLAHLDLIDLAIRFKRMGLEWCFSEELLLELIESVHKENKVDQKRMLGEMSRWAQFCLELLPSSRVCRNYARSIIEETKQVYASPFEPDEEAQKIKVSNLLRPLAKGKLPINIETVWKDSRELQDKDETFRQDIKARRDKGAEHLSLENFAFLYLEARYRNDGLEDPDGKAKGVLSNLDALPHLRVFLVAAHKLSYEWTGKNRMFDLRHLVCATSADWFVTDDEPLGKFAKKIFDDKPRTLSQDELFKQIGSA